MKRYDFNSFEQFEQADLPIEECGVCIHEKGWWKADLFTCTKSSKVALNRFFRLFPEVASWRDYMESLRKFNDKDGAGVCFEIDTTNADTAGIYIFLNINEQGRGGLN